MTVHICLCWCVQPHATMTSMASCLGRLSSYVHSGKKLAVAKMMMSDVLKASNRLAVYGMWRCSFVRTLLLSLVADPTLSMQITRVCIHWMRALNLMCSHISDNLESAVDTRLASVSLFSLASLDYFWGGILTVFFCFFCLFICQQNISESYERIFYQIFWIIGAWPRDFPLHFGGNPDSFTYPGTFSRIVHHHERYGENWHFEVYPGKLSTNIMKLTANVGSMVRNNPRWFWGRLAFVRVSGFHGFKIPRLQMKRNVTLGHGSAKSGPRAKSSPRALSIWPVANHQF